jgi:hypothetical protein
MVIRNKYLVARVEAISADSLPESVARPIKDAAAGIGEWKRQFSARPLEKHGR